jgi:mgtE-like transporter
MLPLTMIVSLKSFEHGWDPDNVTTPIIASLGDLFTLPSLILSLFLVLFLGNFIIKIILFIFFIFITLFGFYYGIKSKGIMKKIIKQSTPVLLFSSFLGISAGGVLNSSISTLIKNPSLLTLVPLFSGESGSLISILGARLSSALHSGLIEPILKPDNETTRNFMIIIVLAILIYPFIAIICEISSFFMGFPTLGIFSAIIISTISGFILIPILIIIVFYISSLSFIKGLDPDNIVIPISTSLTDLISNLILVIVSLAILGLI